MGEFKVVISMIQSRYHINGKYNWWSLQIHRNITFSFFRVGTSYFRVQMQVINRQCTYSAILERKKKNIWSITYNIMKNIQVVPMGTYQVPIGIIKKNFSLTIKHVAKRLKLSGGDLAHPLIIYITIQYLHSLPTLTPQTNSKPTQSI